MFLKGLDARVPLRVAPPRDARPSHTWSEMGASRAKLLPDQWDLSIIGGMFRDKEVLIAIGAFVAIEFAFVAVMVLLTGGH